jgi:lysine/ornithine N-monooxygenase
VVGKVGFNLGVTITEAAVKNGRVSLQFTDNAGTKKTLTADHIIAATGYKSDRSRLTFLDSEILSALRCVEQSPALSSNFESSVRDLYFVGVTAANTFGPMLRFAYGAGFAAPRISKRLARTASRNSVQRESISKAQPSVEREAAEPVAR